MPLVLQPGVAKKIPAGSDLIFQMHYTPNGQAQKVVNYLSDAGFVVLPMESAPAGLKKTEIIFREKTSRQRDVVSSYLKIYSFLNSFRRAKVSGADVAIVIGSDFKGIPF